MADKCGWMRESELSLVEDEVVEKYKCINEEQSGKKVWYHSPTYGWELLKEAFIHKAANGELEIWGNQGGVKETNANRCHEYANYLPWEESAHPFDEIRTIEPGANLQVRYRVAHWDGSKEGYHMVFDETNGVTEANGGWVFVNAYECGIPKPPGN
jgi:hypothetical protein